MFTLFVPYLIFICIVYVMWQLNALNGFRFQLLINAISGGGVGQIPRSLIGGDRQIPRTLIAEDTAFSDPGRSSPTQVT